MFGSIEPEPERAAIAEKFGVTAADRYDVKGFIRLLAVPGRKPTNPASVWRWMRSGRLNFTRVGRSVVITGTDAVDFLAAGASGGPLRREPLRSPANKRRGHLAAMRHLTAAGLIDQDRK